MAVIVVAEDEFLLSDMLVMFLEDAGHEVMAASQGAAALAIILDREVDLLITDFMMPKMTGLELAQAVRDNETSADLPVVLVSGAQGSIGRERPDLFDVVFDKPYNLDRLLEAAEKLIADRGN